MVDLPQVEDVDECLDPALNDCSPEEVCHNTDGYYSCICKQGSC